jgi:predicted Fe-Mo cluster-binding NifX family protein
LKNLAREMLAQPLKGIFLFNWELIQKQVNWMKIAIPIWDNKISPVLDTASKLLVVEVKDQVESSRFEVFLDEQELVRRCRRICGMEIDLLICGAVSRPFHGMLMALGVRIIQDISGHPEDVLSAYLQHKTLCPRFLMPGCGAKRERRNKQCAGNGSRQKHKRPDPGAAG